MTQAERPVYSSGGYDWATDWTDAGILFLSDNPNWVTYRIYPSGSVEPVAGASPYPKWAVFSPDRSKIVYAANPGSGWALVVANADGSNGQPIPNGGGVYSSDTAVAWSRIR